MSAENTNTDLSTGQAVPSLDKRGNDEFASLLGGDGAGSGNESNRGTTQTTETKVAGTNDKPALEQTTLSKPVDTQTQQTDVGQQSQQSQQTQQTQQSQTTGIDPAIINQIVDASVRSAVGAQRSQTAAEAQVAHDKRELTAEEFNAKYQIQNVDESVIQGIFDADPKKGAAMLRQLLVGNMRSAVLMAKDIVESRLDAVRSEYAPHVQSWQTFQQEQFRAKLETDFYTEYPALVNEKPLVDEMRNAVLGRIAVGQMQKFNTPKEAFKVTADLVNATLARMGRQTTNGAGTTQLQSNSQQQGQGQATHTRQMAAASTAGQSGAGRSAGKSDEEKVFGNDWV